MRVNIVEVSSGFRNVPNKIILHDAYGSAGGRPGSAYDRFYTIELPDGFAISENAVGERMIYHGVNHVELASIDHTKGWATGVSLDGFHRFRIVED